ncbi:hypothetical protein [Arthrobacter sp. UYCo732]|uniref:hypothetical protein n=1 Tax=Arthrobacter sp. UYCo732 TaxID=3156336 RepID=UPI00339810D2
MTALLRPVLFLDVDGPIVTIVDPANDYSDPRVAWTRNDSTGVRYNLEVVGWIHELAGLAEIRWLTAWEKSAAAELAPALGLPEFEVIPFEEHRFKELDWKHSAVLAQLIDEPTRPVAWLDDEPEYRDAYDQLVPHALANKVPFFIVRPTLSDGLTEAHMIRLRTFLGRGS